MRVRNCLLLALLPLLISAAPQTKEPIEVYFSPRGGCTNAVVQEIGRAKQSVRIQAYSFTSTPIAKAIIEAKKRGVKIEAVLDKSNRTDHRPLLGSDIPEEPGRRCAD